METHSSALLPRLRHAAGAIAALRSALAEGDPERMAQAAEQVAAAADQLAVAAAAGSGDTELMAVLQVIEANAAMALLVAQLVDVTVAEWQALAGIASDGAYTARGAQRPVAAALRAVAFQG